MTSRRRDRTIRLAHLRNRHLTATETALNTVGTHNRQISPTSVGSRLRKIGLRARRPYVGLPLTQARRLRRMAWLTAHAPRLFPMRQWRRVLFTDESSFTLCHADGRRRVYRRRGERFADACVVERDRFGGGSVMVWGGIAHGIKSQLIIVAGNITAVRYRDEILRPVAVPLVQQRNLILQQDNARPHVARVCQDFLANNNIAPLAWLPYSPDLTPIEHMWDELDRRFFFLVFFLFGFYGPFKNISLISSRSFIEGGRKPEYPDKNHLTIRKQNLAFPHMTRARLEPQR